MARCDLLRLTAARLNHPKRDALSRPRTDSRHLPKLRDQIPDRRRVFRSSQARGSLISGRGEMQGEGFETPQIKLKRRVVSSVRPTSLLKFRVGFGPAFLAVKDDAVPERIAPRDLLWGSVFRERKRFVDFMPFPHIDPAQKINRPRHDCVLLASSNVRGPIRMRDP